MTMKPVKPGWKTSEFWILIALAIGELSAALAGALPPKWAAVLLTASGIAYKVSRALAKVGSAEAKGFAGEQSSADKFNANRVGPADAEKDVSP